MVKFEERTLKYLFVVLLVNSGQKVESRNSIVSSPGKIKQKSQNKEILICEGWKRFFLTFYFGKRIGFWTTWKYACFCDGHKNKDFFSIFQKLKKPKKHDKQLFIKHFEMAFLDFGKKYVFPVLVTHSVLVNLYPKKLTFPILK